MDNNISLQTIDRVVTRTKDITKILSDDTINQILRNNNELIGYSSSLIKSLEKMESQREIESLRNLKAAAVSTSTIASYISNQTEEIASEINKSTTEIVNSINDQTSILSYQVDSINKSIKKAGEELSYVLECIDSDIRMIGIMKKDELKIQRKTFEKLCEIHDTLKHPLTVEANELIERGVTMMSKGFLPESVSAFNQAIEKDPTNFLPHFYLGQLFLCGINDDDCVIDFEKSEKEFNLAVRYSKPDLGIVYVKKYAVSIHQYFSDLYYAKAIKGGNPQENFEKAYQELLTALSIDKSVETKKCLNTRLIRCASRTNLKKELYQYAVFGFTNDYATLSLLGDEALASEKDSLLDALKEAQGNVYEILCKELVEKKHNLKLLEKALIYTEDKNSNSYLGLFSILDSIRG